MVRSILALGIAAILLSSATAYAQDLSAAPMARWHGATETEKKATARAAANSYMTEGKQGMRGKFADWVKDCVDQHGGSDTRKVDSVIEACAKKYREQ